MAKKSLHFTFPWMIHYLTDDYKDKHHHVVVDSILSSILVVFLIINIGLVYWFYLFMVPVAFDVEIKPQEQIISGHEFEFEVAYENNDRRLNNTQITLEYPEGFEYQSSTLSPKEGTNNVFEFGTLPRNTKGNFYVKGILYGNVNSRQRILALSDFSFHGLNENEADTASFEITNSTFETVVEIPDKILNDEQFELTIKYVNSSPIEQKDVKVALDIPQDLEIIYSEGIEYNSETKEITIPQVNAWESNEIKLPARFSNIAGEVTQSIRISSIVTQHNQSYVQNELQELIHVLTPRIQLTTYINGAQNSLSNFDNNITYSAVIKNIGDVELKNIAVTGNLENILGKTSYLNSGGGVISGTQIKWDQNSNSNLQALGPGQSTTVSINAKIADNVRPENFQISWNASCDAQIDDLNVSTYSRSSSSASKFNSDLDFIAQAQYFSGEGEQIGYGPYPLKADETTALRVFWRVQDFSNNLSNITIQTTLPSQVEWTGLTSVSEGTAISYDPGSRVVTWHTSKLDANTHPQGANFELRITPNFAQIGQIINITNDAELTAKDSYTGNVITRYAGAVRLPDPVTKR